MALACGLFLAIMALAETPAVAQVSGVSYTFSPTYEVVRWDEDLGLEDTALYGGRLGMNFGRYLGLQGFYLTRSNVDSEVSKLGLQDHLGTSLIDREFDIENYGASLVLGLSRGPVIPILRAGGGVLVLDAPGTDRLHQINLKLGGGVRFGIRRLQAEVYVEDSAFRIDRTRLGTAVHEAEPVPADPDANNLRHNLSLGAGLTFFLGGHDSSGETDLDRAIADRYQSGLRGLSVPIEPFVGRVDFDDKNGLKNQELVGLRTGVDLGRLVGIRGYYWRGVEKDFDDTDGIQSYGGEAQFNLNAGRGAVPYVVAGVGQLDFMNGFRDPLEMSRDDKTMLILGGGVGFTLGSRFRVDVSARDYIMSETVAAEDVATTDELSTNWMLSAGLRFSLGGGGGQTEPKPRPRPRPDEPMAPMSEAPPAVEASADTSAVHASAPDSAVIDSTETSAEFSRVRGQTPALSESTKTGDGLPPARNYQSDRIIAIPVPIEGEIYIRYGRPGGVNIEPRRTGRDAPSAAGLQGSVIAPPGAETHLSEHAEGDSIPAELNAIGVARQPAVSASDLAQMEERLARRIDGRMDRVETEIRSLQGAALERSGGAIIDDTGERTVSSDTEVGLEDKPYQWSAAAIRPYTGANLDDPTQGLFGAKVDMGPVTRDSDFHFLPEIVLGLGSDMTTFMVAGNLEYQFRDVTERGSWSPQVGLGFGVLNSNTSGDSHSEGVLNLNYGVTAKLNRFVLVAEHQGVDLFDLNRFLLGLRLGF